MNPLLERVLRNLAILAVVALPMAILAGGAVAKLAPPEWAEGMAAGNDPLSALLFQYFILVLPILLGGALHQLVLWFASPRWRPLGQRVFAIITTPVVVVILLLGAAPPLLLLSWRALIPIGIGLLTYGALARLPRAVLEKVSKEQEPL